MRSLAPARLTVAAVVVMVLLGGGAALSACGSNDASGLETLAPTAEGPLSGIDVDLHFAEG